MEKNGYTLIHDEEESIDGLDDSEWKVEYIGDQWYLEGTYDNKFVDEELFTFSYLLGGEVVGNHLVVLPENQTRDYGDMDCGTYFTDEQLEKIADKMKDVLLEYEIYVDIKDVIYDYDKALKCYDEV